MKALKIFLAVAVIVLFTYIALEQGMGIGTIFNQETPVVSIPTENPPEPTGIEQEENDNSNLLEVFDIPYSSGIETVYGNGDGDSEDNIYNPEDSSVDNIVKILITAAGDCTLGSDAAYGYENSFMHEYERQGGDSSYFFRNVADLFAASDLSIVNLEGPLTDSVKKADKQFAFKGLPEFTEILSFGNIDAVTVANNHSKDYSTEGYNDTVRHLENASVMYFGNEYTAMTEIKGIKVGMFGYSTWYVDNAIKNNITDSINRLREMGAQLIIAYFHWGDENTALPNATQKTYAHFAVDSGADLVLGSHPHVIQGIEEYNGKQIVYSFGNFCFGGNRNPTDKDTYLFRQTFTFENGALIQDADIGIIPARISSVTNRNNFQPTILEGEERDRVANKIIERSKTFNSEEKLRLAISE